MSPPNRFYWLTTEQMTVLVVCNPMGVVIETPPIIHRFIGQPFDNLLFWLQKQPGFQFEELTQMNAMRKPTGP